MYKFLCYIFIIAVLLFVNCRREVQTVMQKNLEDSVLVLDSPLDTIEVEVEITTSSTKVDSIYGDTVWVYPYGIQLWNDTLVNSEYSVFMSVWVDTTDFLIDTVKSKKGNRIVIGYNHYYKLEFRKEDEKWFTSEFNKREHLANLLIDSEYWLESNLDVFQKIHFNSEFEKFVVEFDINPRYNYGSIYYLVISTTGEIEHLGISNTWGGGGPDGSSFLSADMSSFISCFDVYNFQYNMAISIAEYVMLAENRMSGETAPRYRQIHALRKLGGNNFLVIFNRYKGKPELNGLILAMDTSILKRFRYYGFMEEMDAMLLFVEKPDIAKYFLYDTERKALICVSEKDTIKINELLMTDIQSLSKDSLNGQHYSELDFEAFGSYRFYIDSSATEIFRGEESID